MVLYITSLNSGSNGNCYYIGNDHEAVLIDAGLSCRETERRLSRLQLSMNKVKAIFISHEHSDHIRGLPVLAAKYNLPVYITVSTLQHCPFSLQASDVRSFAGYQPVTIGGLSITAFPKFHDAVEPHSFLISGNGIKVGVFTDIGAPCKHLAYHFKQCHAAFLEANYDEALLENGRYPYHLKNRIRGGKGHLSNRQALKFFTSQKPEYMSHLILAHLSKENNSPQLVADLFQPYAATTNISVASRYEETPVYAITNRSATFAASIPVSKRAVASTQISLF